MSERLLPISEVLRRVPVHRATLYRWIKAGTFPRPVELSPQCVMWKASEVDAYIAALPTTSDGRIAVRKPAGAPSSEGPPTPAR